MKNIKHHILQLFKKKGRLTSSELMKEFEISRQAIHRHLQNLIKESQILKQGSSRMTAYYILNTPGMRRKIGGAPRRFHKRVKAENASEDKIFAEIESQAGLLAGITENAERNIQYAFTEMLNNAIDHSGSALIDIGFTLSPQMCSFVVRDTGVGIFENIMNKMGLTSEMEAIEDLLKGKQTTMPERHSGEGIFFTSKISDRFVLESHRKRIVVDNRISDIFVEDIRHLKGTKVLCEIDAHSKKNISELFSEYTSESFAFDKTKVTVKLFESGESYVSRSQAKRLIHSLEKFREIVLDFSGVKTVGQGFADEVFRVFQNVHPDIKIVPINMNENIEFMVRRAKSI